MVVSIETAHGLVVPEVPVADIPSPLLFGIRTPEKQEGTEQTSSMTEQSVKVVSQKSKTHSGHVVSVTLTTTKTKCFTRKTEMKTSAGLVSQTIMSSVTIAVRSIVRVEATGIDVTSLTFPVSITTPTSQEPYSLARIDTTSVLN